MPDPAVQINAKQKPMYIKVVDEAPHYTSGDRVRGVLRVDPTLRPQRIRLALKGFSILSDLTSNLATPTLFSHEQSMFESSGAHGNFDIMKKGTAADGKVELPFEFVFPYTVESTPPLDRDWQNVADSREQPRFQHSPGFSLPPSCSREVTIIERAAPVIMNRRPGTVIKSTPKVVLSRNVYALEACSESATPDTPPLQIRQELKFIPPAPEYDSRLLQPLVELGINVPKQTSRYKLIRTRRLLPDYGSSSKLGKLRDVLVEKELYFGLHSYTEVPYAKFNILASPARVQVIGSPLPIILSVQHLDRSSSLPDPPEVYMRRLRVQLLSTFTIYVPPTQKRNYRTVEILETNKDALTLVDRKFDGGEGHLLDEGFNIGVMEDIQLAHPKLVPSFRSYGMSQEYELQVEVWGECAKSEFLGIACKESVQVVSAWSAAVQPGAAPPAQQEARPEYSELDSTTRHEIAGDIPRRWLPGDAPDYDEDDYAAPPAPAEAGRPTPPPYMA